MVNFDTAAVLEVALVVGRCTQSLTFGSESWESSARIAYGCVDKV